MVGRKFKEALEESLQYADDEEIPGNYLAILTMVSRALYIHGVRSLIIATGDPLRGQLSIENTMDNEDIGSTMFVQVIHRIMQSNLPPGLADAFSGPVGTLAAGMARKFIEQMKEDEKAKAEKAARTRTRSSTNGRKDPK